jgi:lipopolysaccharide export system protein LptA
MQGAALSRPAGNLWLLGVAAGLAGVLGAGSALAERADRDRPVNIESDRMSADDAKRTAVFEGRVVLTQGTLTLRAERIAVRQDNQGFQFALASGSPATFRQKREGAGEYVEGEAERIEYDGKAERIQFFSRARLKRDGGDDVRGDTISYDAKTEFFSVHSAKDAPQSGDGRVRAVIMPKNRETGAARPGAPDESKRAARSAPEARPAPSPGAARSE